MMLAAFSVATGALVAGALFSLGAPLYAALSFGIVAAPVAFAVADNSSRR